LGFSRRAFGTCARRFRTQKKKNADEESRRRKQKKKAERRKKKKKNSALGGLPQRARCGLLR
jgi:hypothetical protein